MKKIMVLNLLIATSLSSGGCASIVNGQNQSLSVDAKKGGVAVAGANCKLSNNKGVWFVTTPGTTTVHRSYEPLAVRCEKEGEQPGLVTAKSSTKGMAFGNILFGGIIGAGVDISTGAAYDYPDLISVEMGQNMVPPMEAPGDKAVEKPAEKVVDAPIKAASAQ